MYEDYFLSFIPKVLVDSPAHYIELIVKDIETVHASCSLKQFIYVKINFEYISPLCKLRLRRLLMCFIALFLLKDNLCYLFGIGKYLLRRLVINNKFVYQCTLIKERILTEKMQLVELDGIYTAFNIHCRLKGKGLLLLERQ